MKMKFGIVQAIVLLLALLPLQGCCLIGDCVCNHQNQIRNCTGETLECRIVSKKRERVCKLEPLETLNVYNGDLFIIRQGKSDAVFSSLFCTICKYPLEVVRKNGNLQMALNLQDTEWLCAEEVIPPPQDGYLLPIFVPQGKQFSWTTLVNDTMLGEYEQQVLLSQSNEKCAE